MTSEHKPNPTQADRILKVLEEAKSEWTNGRFFIQTMMISQAHARIWELQKKGHKIEASDFKDEYGFRSYRLVNQTVEEKVKFWNEGIANRDEKEIVEKLNNGTKLNYVVLENQIKLEI